MCARSLGSMSCCQFGLFHPLLTPIPPAPFNGCSYHPVIVLCLVPKPCHVSRPPTTLDTILESSSVTCCTIHTLVALLFPSYISLFSQCIELRRQVMMICYITSYRVSKAGLTILATAKVRLDARAELRGSTTQSVVTGYSRLEDRRCGRLKGRLACDSRRLPTSRPDSRRPALPETPTPTRRARISKAPACRQG